MTQERDDAAGQYLLALDIDGTLLETGQKPVPLVVRTLAEVLAAGHVVVLATGRSLAGALPVAAQLGMRDGWLITSNGAVTTRVRGGKARIVERHAVDAERVVRFLSPKARLRMAAESLVTATGSATRSRQTSSRAYGSPRTSKDCGRPPPRVWRWSVTPRPGSSTTCAPWA
ncbi:HAD family hydrolase [Myceligenerans pegani]|uniref:HAD hydrolase family protein n=1 Tax=Myceligenerans pegani TaxID=2776917 RepID=A0ABR9MUM4_9MICO|nr:HAD hydrolase family protein [Myceligenerans sp. TRM 65318]MBE1874477.1 HAD hydrolase family protein [Myceligenerans sp. TRM 65318]MBE3016748.1 HAD hydrolase family protein [Myceligenerans sp. TRM 65318]